MITTWATENAITGAYVLGAVVLGFVAAGRTRRGRYVLDSLKTRVPLFGRLIIKKLNAALEPVLLIFLGLMVGFVAAAMIGGILASYEM
ncbi:MAG: hypothetical protein AB1402_02210 [Bacillota bacterium]